MQKNTHNILRIPFILTVFLFFLYLLLCPGMAADGARSGLLLWYQSVLPVLFPFMLLCSIILRLNLAQNAISILGRPLRHLFGCSEYGAFVLLTGFLCGLPMGAKLTSDLSKQGKISSREAYWLYGFVNNLSPAFIMSYVASDQMGRPRWRFLYLLIILGAAMIYGICSGRKASSLPQAPSDQPPEEPISASGGGLLRLLSEIDICLNDTIQNVVRLGGYIVVFSIISNGAAAYLPQNRPVLLLGAACIEVTGGIRLICRSQLPLLVRFVLTCTVSAFGGLSALMQTISIAGMDGVTARHYIKSRVMITLLSMLLSIAAVLFFFCFFRD